MARISTHVLDTAKGRPAAGIPVDLRFAGEVIASTITNADGRTDAPVLATEHIEPGAYELVFHVSDYLEKPFFFDQITLRFIVSEPGGHYHVPLLLSPYGYSTYRGS